MQTRENYKQQIFDIIKRLNLNLKGRTVLTEAASGAYCVTAIIAALSGANVFALAKSTKYGTAKDVIGFMRSQVRAFGDLNIELVERLTPDIIRGVDVITNSGHLRPLDRTKLQHVKKGCVIPLMYEAWEFRGKDLDLVYCKKRKILVGATNERHNDVRVFDYLGDLSVQLIKNAGLSGRGKFVLLCNNDFGPYIARTLMKRGINLGVIDLSKRKKEYPKDIVWLGDFPNVRSSREFQDAKAIIFTAYPFDKTWIGNNATIEASDLKEYFPKAAVLRFAGHIDEKQLKRNAVGYFPKNVRCGHMGILLSDLGYAPIIKLQAAGLKAAEAMLTKKMNYRGERICQLL